ncbi:response regulator transcription factor [Nocardia sp. NPDC050710]|uniref:response regulator transcription factor n=1 Tax=Nocardia sp. NPDC050710 TaxID=3157220 RepID=UPI00340B0CB8
MTEGSISVLVVDDHTMLRSALCAMLRMEPDIDVVADAAGGSVGVGYAARFNPDVVILDVEIPGDEVAVTLGLLREVSPGSRVLIVSMYEDMALIKELVGLGIAGYLHKSASRDTLLSTIRKVGARTDETPGVVIYVSWQEERSARERFGEERPTEFGLTMRELEVLNGVAAALSNRQIAAALGITEGTVKRHLRNIFEKLGAVSRLDAVNRALSANLINARPTQFGPD